MTAKTGQFRRLRRPNSDGELAGRDGGAQGSLPMRMAFHQRAPHCDPGPGQGWDWITMPIGVSHEIQTPGAVGCAAGHPRDTQKGLLTVATFRSWRGSKSFAAQDPAAQPVTLGKSSIILSRASSTIDAPIAQLDRALDFGSSGCGFESCWARSIREGRQMSSLSCLPAMFHVKRASPPATQRGWGFP